MLRLVIPHATLMGRNTEVTGRATKMSSAVSKTKPTHLCLRIARQYISTIKLDKLIVPLQFVGCKRKLIWLGHKKRNFKAHVISETDSCATQQNH